LYKENKDNREKEKSREKSTDTEPRARKKGMKTS
jgi:hypothetical protein